MAVTDDQVATLRAQLSGRVEEHKRLLAQLDEDAANTGYVALIGAAFFEAVCRRFGNNGTVGDVVEFVADVRSTSDEVARDLDPQMAERLVRAMLGDGSVKDVDDRTKFSAQILLLAGLMRDARLSDSELEDFLALARETAEEWTK